MGIIHIIYTSGSQTLGLRDFECVYLRTLTQSDRPTMTVLDHLERPRGSVDHTLRTTNLHKRLEDLFQTQSSPSSCDSLRLNGYDTERHWEGSPEDVIPWPMKRQQA